MAERMLSPFSKGASHADCRVECPRLQVMAHCKLMAKSGPEAYRGPARRSQRALDRPNACAVPVAGTLRQCALEKKCFKRAVHLLRRRAVYSQAQVVPYYASAGALRQCALRVERSVSKGPYRFSEGEPSRQRRSPAPRSITAARTGPPRPPAACPWSPGSTRPSRGGSRSSGPQTSGNAVVMLRLRGPGNVRGSASAVYVRFAVMQFDSD